MSNRQFVLFVALVVALSSGLAWWLQRFELDERRAGFHNEISKYAERWAEFRLWEEQNGNA